MSCNERIYELIGEIIAYPESAIEFAQPFNLMKKYILPAEFTTTENAAIHIPLKKKSGTLKETPSVTVNGESYEVTLSWQVENITSQTYVTLDSLKEGNKHVKVITFGDGQMLIRSTEYAYEFEYKEYEGYISCELTIQNVCGAQRVL